MSDNRHRSGNRASPSPARRGQTKLAVLLWLSLIVTAFAAVTPDERTGVEGRDFRVPLESHAPPHQGQVKTLLQGAKAQPLSGGRILLTAATLKTFGTNGALQMTASTPECIFD